MFRKSYQLTPSELKSFEEQGMSRDVIFKWQEAEFRKQNPPKDIKKPKPKVIQPKKQIKRIAPRPSPFSGKNKRSFPVRF